MLRRLPAYSQSLFAHLLLLLLSRFSRVRLCAIPEMAAHQAPPSLGFSRQEHWGGLPSSSNAWKWKVKVKSLSSVRLLATPWAAAYQAPPSMGFFRQEYWSGVPLPSPVQSEHSANITEGITEQSHAGFLECSCLFPTLKGESVPCSKTLTTRSLSFFSHQDTGEAHLICVTGCWTVCCLGGQWNQLLSSQNKDTFWKHVGMIMTIIWDLGWGASHVEQPSLFYTRGTSLNTNTRTKEKGD